MDQVVPLLVCVAGILALFFIWRRAWIQNEVRKLVTVESAFDNARFDSEVVEDEDDKMYSGRVIKRLRSRVIDGRIEIHWQFHPEYIHRGFELTGQERRNDGTWQPLPFAPYQDSGSWIDSFKYGEIATFLFSVKKTYYIFFGIFGKDDMDVVYDQISFSLRKGRYHKEQKEHLEDRTEALAALEKFLGIGNRLRGKARGIEGEESEPKIDAKTRKFEERLARRREFEEMIARKEAEIRAHPTWSDEKKQEEIDRLRDLAEEIAMED